MFEDVKRYEKDSDHGDMCYARVGHVLFLQWHDSRVVSMLSTVHKTL